MAKARIKCQKCDTYNYIYTTFCVSCGDKLTHQPEHTVITEKIPKLPKGEAKKKADFYAPNNNAKAKPNASPVNDKNKAVLKTLLKTLIFSFTIIFIALIIYPPKIYAPDPIDADLESFEKKSQAYMSGQINTATFTSAEIAAFLHVKALQPTIIENSKGTIYFIFPSRVRLSIMPKFLKLYLYMKVYGIDVIVGVKGSLIVKRDGYMYLSLESISLGRLPVPKAVLTQMTKSIAISFKYPLPDQISDIVLREDTLTLVSQTMRSPKRRIRREETAFIYEETKSETEKENFTLEENSEMEEDSQKSNKEKIKALQKTRVNLKEKNDNNKQLDFEMGESLEEDSLPTVDDINNEIIEEQIPTKDVTAAQNTENIDSKKTKKSSNDSDVTALSQEETAKCHKLKLKGDFLYNSKQYKTALIFYNKIVNLYPGYKKIDTIKKRIAEIENKN